MIGSDGEGSGYGVGVGIEAVVEGVRFEELEIGESSGKDGGDVCPRDDRLRDSFLKDDKLSDDVLSNVDLFDKELLDELEDKEVRDGELHPHNNVDTITINIIESLHFIDIIKPPLLMLF